VHSFSFGSWACSDGDVSLIRGLRLHVDEKHPFSDMERSGWLLS